MKPKKTDDQSRARKARLIPNPVNAILADYPQKQVGTHTITHAPDLDIDQVAAKLGGTVVHGPDGHSVIQTPNPGEPEAIEQADLALQMLNAFLAQIRAPAAIVEVLRALDQNLRWVIQSKSDELLRLAAKILELQAVSRKEDFVRRGSLRVKNNPEAKAKAEAKASAEALWNQWMDAKPKKTWRNEDFAAEALRRWPGKIASIGVVVGWIPEWKRARLAKSR